MDVDKAILERRSVRKYSSQPVEFEKIIEIIESARYAPSAGNLQGWRFIVINDNKLKQDLAFACYEQYWMSSAPLYIVACALSEKYEEFYGAKGTDLYSIIDCSLAIENMLLKAVDLGLATCIVSAFDDSRVHELLSVPANVKVIAIIPIGYPDEKPPMPRKESLETITFFDVFGNRKKELDLVMKDYSKILEKKIKKTLETVKKARTPKDKEKKKVALIEKIKGLKKIVTNDDLKELEEEDYY